MPRIACGHVSANDTQACAQQTAETEADHDIEISPRTEESAGCQDFSDIFLGKPINDERKLLDAFVRYLSQVATGKSAREVWRKDKNGKPLFEPPWWKKAFAEELNKAEEKIRQQTSWKESSRNRWKNPTDKTYDSMDVLKIKVRILITHLRQENKVPSEIDRLYELYSQGESESWKNKCLFLSAHCKLKGAAQDISKMTVGDMDLVARLKLALRQNEVAIERLPVQATSQKSLTYATPVTPGNYPHNLAHRSLRASKGPYGSNVSGDDRRGDCNLVVPNLQMQKTGDRDKNALLLRGAYEVQKLTQSPFAGRTTDRLGVSIRQSRNNVNHPEGTRHGTVEVEDVAAGSTVLEKEMKAEQLQTDTVPQHAREALSVNSLALPRTLDEDTATPPGSLSQEEPGNMRGQQVLSKASGCSATQVVPAGSGYSTTQIVSADSGCSAVAEQPVSLGTTLCPSYSVLRPAQTKPDPLGQKSCMSVSAKRKLENTDGDRQKRCKHKSCSRSGSSFSPTKPVSTPADSDAKPSSSPAKEKPGSVLYSCTTKQTLTRDTGLTLSCSSSTEQAIRVDPGPTSSSSPAKQKSVTQDSDSLSESLEIIISGHSGSDISREKFATSLQLGNNGRALLPAKYPSSSTAPSGSVETDIPLRQNAPPSPLSVTNSQFRQRQLDDIKLYGQVLADFSG